MHIDLCMCVISNLDSHERASYCICVSLASLVVNFHATGIKKLALAEISVVVVVVAVLF